MWQLFLPLSGSGPDEPAHYDVVKYMRSHWTPPDVRTDSAFQPKVIKLPGSELSYAYVSYATMPTGAYAVSALASALPPDGNGPDRQQARLPQALFAAVLVLVMFQLVRRMFPAHEQIAVAATAIAAFWPRITFTAAYVNNDALMVLATTAVIWRWWEGARQGWTWRSAAWLGVAMGVALLAKPNGYLVVMLGMFVALATMRRPLRLAAVRVAVAGAVAAMVALPWLALAMHRYGTDIFASQLTADLLARLPHSAIDGAARGVSYLEMVRTYWLNDVARSFLAVTNMTTSLLALVVIVLGMAATGLALRLAELLRRPRSLLRTRLQWLHLITLLPVPLLLVAASVNSYLHDAFYGAQGRYLLPAFATFSAYAAFGLWSIAREPFRQRVVLAGTSLLLLGVNVAQFHRLLWAHHREAMDARLAPLVPAATAIWIIALIGVAGVLAAYWSGWQLRRPFRGAHATSANR